jgi:DNA-binding MarR family transcriptional regulator
MKPLPRGKAERILAVPVTGAENAAFALERFVPYRLSVLTNIMSRAIGRIYIKRFGLTIPEWRVMAVLGRYAPLSANEVCERTEMDKVRVSRAVARMRKARLIERAIDGADRRRSALRLSAAGRKIHAAIVPLALAKESEFLTGLNDADRAVLDRLLTRLAERARALDQADD